MNKVISWIAAIGAIGWTIFIVYAIVESSSHYYGTGFFAWVGRLSGEGKLLLFFSSPFVGAFFAGLLAAAIALALGETVFKLISRSFKD